MKYTIKSALLLLCGVAFLAACDDDRDNNPTLQEPSSFVLNTPAYSKANVDLQTSSELAFTWSQPAYGFPAAASYQIQMSPTNTWTKDILDGDLDASGQTFGTYKTFDTEFSVVKGAIQASDVATALEQILHYAEDAVPSSQNVYVRVRAAYAGDTIYSNTVQVNVLPYYVELKDADPIIYYLVGGCIADGKWTNSADAIGTSMTPLLPVPGTEFDKATGAGQIEWYGYLPDAAEFKIIFTPGDWDNGLCGKKNDYDNDEHGIDMQTSLRIDGKSVDHPATGDPGNIYVATAGYYHIVVNTNPDYSKVTCTIEKYDKTPNTLQTITMPGAYNEWAADGNPMTALNTAESNSAYNHDWVETLTLGSDTELKFNDGTSSWTFNWGATDFPYGTGTQGGSNIPATAGTYKVFFNDISGTYYFIAQE